MKWLLSPNSSPCCSTKEKITVFSLVVVSLGLHMEYLSILAFLISQGSALKNSFPVAAANMGRD